MAAKDLPDTSVEAAKQSFVANTRSAQVTLPGPFRRLPVGLRRELRVYRIIAALQDEVRLTKQILIENAHRLSAPPCRHISEDVGAAAAESTIHPRARVGALLPPAAASSTARPRRGSVRRSDALCAQIN